MTTGNGICSFHRIFLRNAFHMAILVGSDENASVKSISDSLYDVFFKRKLLL